MIGSKLAHYEITALLGKGGMGEVYRARDTKLQREVAIKIVSPQLASDPERLARFAREARTLASLHHRRIASLFSIEEAEGRTFLVMELVEGMDLAERLGTHGAPSVGEALRIGLQITEGLEFAHEKGVVHRDLKPGNVKVTPEGEVKILDFGLARAYTGDPLDDHDMSTSPTITAAMTTAGMILGTAAYMSPEQAKGKPVDRRADIWSFGAVLFEMLTGKPVFAGETASETMADVMKGEIPWDALPSDLSPRVRALLRRCLDRDPKQRLRDIGEARIVLSDPGREAPVIAEAPRSRARLPWIVALLAVVVAAGAWFVPRNVDEAGVETLRFRLRNDFAANLRQGDGRGIAISPDGQTVVSIGTDGDRTTLYTRRLDDFEWSPLRGTNAAAGPFFSPDGQWIGFMQVSRLYKINLNGGAPVLVAEGSSAFTGATWSDDGYIYTVGGGDLYRIPAEGGEFELVVDGGGEGGPPLLRNPSAVPGRDALLLNTEQGTNEESRLVLLDIRTRELRELGLLGTNPALLGNDVLIFGQARQLMACRFDTGSLTPVGTPIPVLDRTWFELSSQTLHLDIADNGTIAYLPADDADRAEIHVVSRDGSRRPLLSRPLSFDSVGDPRLSPDGRRLVLVADGFQVWSIDLESETASLVSPNGFYPLWTGDGRHLLYGTTRNRNYDLMRVPADLSGPETALLDWEDNLRSAAVAPDGSFVFRQEVPDKGMDLWIWPDLGDSATIAPLLTGPEDELGAAISPDGRWVAYVSELSGRDEIYVTSFPRAGGRVQISADGGTSPTWSDDGDEIFYQDGNAMIAATIDTADGVRVTSRQTLFAGGYLQYRWYRQYELMTTDGVEEFIMVENPSRGDIEVVTGWAAEVRGKLDAARR